MLCVCQLSGCRRAAWLRSPFVRTAAAPPAAAAEKKKEKEKGKEQSTDGLPTQTAQPLDAAPSQQKGASASARTASARAAFTERPAALRLPHPSAPSAAPRSPPGQPPRTAHIHTREHRECAHNATHMCTLIGWDRSGRGGRRWLLTLQHRWPAAGLFLFLCPRAAPPSAAALPHAAVLCWTVRAVLDDPCC